MSTRQEMIRGTVKQYPYRTAHVADVFLILPREDLKGLEEQLANAAGDRMDNHTVYEITQEGVTTFIKFTDFKAIFGRSVVERRH